MPTKTIITLHYPWRRLEALAAEALALHPEERAKLADNARHVAYTMAMNNMHGPGQAAYYMTLAGLLDRAGTAEPADPMACQRLAVDSVDVCYTAAAMTPEERRGVMGLADGPFYEASDELLADTFDHRSPR